jgi:hypothetical protein
MVSELAGRAGGLCGAKPLPAGPGPLPISAADVVLWSDYGATGRAASTILSRLRRSGALSIVFASKENPIFRQSLPPHFRGVPVEIQDDSRLVALPGGRRLVPTAPPAIAMAQWAFTAELIGACRRRNRQLAVYLSMYLDEGYKRLKRTTGLLFEPDLRPPAAPGRQFTEQFLAAARGGLEGILRQDGPMIRTAADWLAEAAQRRAKIIRNFQGHLPPVEAGGGGDVDFFTNVKPIAVRGEEGIGWVRENLGSGDVYLLLGYQSNEDATAAAANALGARTIFITSTPSGPLQRSSPRHVYVNPHWPLTDGCLELPGYDVKACPLSAVLGLSCYYAICAETLSRQQR